MNFCQTYIPDTAVEFLMSLAGKEKEYAPANEVVFAFCGIADFFSNQQEFEEFKTLASNKTDLVSDVDRAAYGDFQTNNRLALEVCNLLKSKGLAPGVIIEPTFGKGNFILAALQTFESAESIAGVEIYKPYIWHTKFAILTHYVSKDIFQKNSKKKPRIELHHQSVFDFNFDNLKTSGKQVLVLGNPPWVTNAMLSSLDSDNLPVKSNFKQYNGFDAITGKGNFDIAEYISLMLVRAFHQNPGHIAFLVKNSVIKNLVFDQKQNRFRLSDIEKYGIEAQKEFGAAVDASLFLAKFGSSVQSQCADYDLYRTEDGIKTRFGWAGNNFVSDIDAYTRSSAIDGKCPFEWRQGVKHDCSKIMELERRGGEYNNGNGEPVELENGLVYSLLKSSDLKEPIVRESRKSVIITQTRIGQNTVYIKDRFPKTWAYLDRNREAFDRRKSSIYKRKPPFSIFGIGDYSLAPYKIAISGLYKTWHFTLVYPENGKPVMLDDTCYFLGFEREADAAITFALLNSQRVERFLKSIVFRDSKRMITKEVLMRIDLKVIAGFFTFETVCDELKKYPALKLNRRDWEEYVESLMLVKEVQLAMF